MSMHYVIMTFFSELILILRQEQDMIIEWKINHKLLQDKLMSCKYFKYISSFAVIFLMLSLAMCSTWMIVASVRCSRAQMDNNILSVVMIVLQLILMRQVHRTASQVAYPELVDWSVTFWGPKGLIVGRCDLKSDPGACQGMKNAQK